MALNSLLALFAYLNKEDVSYCHWKSNANLEASFNGETDFDLLVDSKDQAKFSNCLHNFNLKSRRSTANKVFPGMEDYIGFDEESGELYHLHVHYRLVIGRKHRKNYRLPFEKVILETAIFHEHLPIKIIRPEIEYLILLIRSLLKIEFTIRSIIRMSIKMSLFPENILNEYNYLTNQRSDEDSFDAGKLFPPELRDFFNSFKDTPDKLSVFKIILLRRKLQKVLRPFRLFTGKSLRREIKINRLSAQESLSWLSPGGISIAFVGPDGSGKSSAAEHIYRWLGWKFSVENLYMGLPKSDFSWEIIKYSSALTKKIKLDFLSHWLNIIAWIYIAKKRLKIFNCATHFINQGKIVIFDRYPLKAFWDMVEPMDGPRLGKPSYWKDKERLIYRSIKPPDWIFLFLVDDDEAIKRKNEKMYPKKMANLKKKIELANEMAKIKLQNVIVIDSMDTQKQVHNKIKIQIWNRL